MFLNPIIRVLVRMLAYSAVDRALDPLSGQIINLVFAAFFIKHTGLRRKDKDWLAQNQDNVSVSE